MGAQTVGLGPNGIGPARAREDDLHAWERGTHPRGFAHLVSRGVARRIPRVGMARVAVRCRAGSGASVTSLGRELTKVTGRGFATTISLSSASSVTSRPFTDAVAWGAVTWGTDVSAAGC